MVNMQVGNLHAGDVAVIVVYLVGSLTLGLYTILRTKGNLQSVFLAGRSMKWWPIGLSLFASNIGSVNYVGIAGDAAASGLAVVMFEWNAVFLLILLGWIFLPVYIASGIYTMPEYLHYRFGGKRLRIYLSVIALMTYIFSTVSSDLYSGALFMNQCLNINLYAAVAILLLIGLIFTGLGGLETVIITDSLAVLVMVIGGLILCILGFARVGGLEALKYKYMRAVSNYTLNTNTTCGYPREDAWHIVRHPWSADYPSVALMLRTTIGSLWYWCANQVLIQRAIAAKNITHAKAGCIFAGYLKLTPMFLMVLPGMISRTLFPNEVGCADPETCMRVCGSEAGCSNIALPKLVIELLPIGVRGLMVASVIAAVVSSLTSIFNSSSAIFTMDIWINIRKKPSERELLVVGRVFTVILVGVSIVWIPVMAQAEGGQIFRYATTITGLMGAPTCAIFILAMFANRINEQGAFYGMIISQAWGITRFILDMIYPAPRCGVPDDRPGFLINFHAHFHTLSQILMAFLIAGVVSLATKKPSKEQIAGLTFWTRFDKPQKDKDYEERKATLKTAIMNQTVDSNSSQEKSDNLSSSNEANMPKYLGKSEEQVNTDLRERHYNITSSPLHHEDVKDNKDNTEMELSVAGTEETLSLRQRFVYAVCGNNSTDAAGNDDDMIEPHEMRVASIKQSVFKRDLMDANAIILATVTLFIIAFAY